MKKTLLTIRTLFVGLCFLSTYLIWRNAPDVSPEGTLIIFAIGAAIAGLTLLTDNLLRGFSMRSLVAVLIGLTVGVLLASVVTASPLFGLLREGLVPNVTLGVYVVAIYLATVIALRGKDDFSLMIPFVRFSQTNSTTSSVVLDMSALIDGRIATLCQSRFMTCQVIIPRFVVDELHKIAGCEDDPQRQLKGKKGIETLNKLKNMNYIDMRIKDIELNEGEDMGGKVIFFTRTINSKILTTDYNLAKQAEFHGIEWLNINALRKALNPEVAIGQYLDVELVKSGKEEHQGVGYLSDGSMVVVNEAFDFIGKTVAAEVISVLPSAGGKMIFARLHARPVEV